MLIESDVLHDELFLELLSKKLKQGKKTKIFN